MWWNWFKEGKNQLSLFIPFSRKRFGRQYKQMSAISLREYIFRKLGFHGLLHTLWRELFSVKNYLTDQSILVGRAMDFDLKTYLWNGWRMNRRSQYKQMMMMSGFLTMQNIKENSNVETFLYHYLLMFTQIQRKFQIKPDTRHHTQRLKGIWLVFRQQWMSESVLNWDWHEHNLEGSLNLWCGKFFLLLARSHRGSASKGSRSL